jgi:uncharacterized protein
MVQVSIPFRILALREEQNTLIDYPVERLAGIIGDTGFACTRCGKCCTRAQNGHVFLLDREVDRARKMDPGSLEPAPVPEFCDREGTFYVSGYALRANDDTVGSCIFLENNRCRIYDDRFSVCRTYPYTLHRERNAGAVEWRYLSKKNRHGSYTRTIPGDECYTLALETKEYENAFLNHQIAFLEFMQDHFTRNNSGHSPKRYEEQVRRFSHGQPVDVMVFANDELERTTVTGPGNFFS